MTEERGRHIASWCIFGGAILATIVIYAPIFGHDFHSFWDDRAFVQFRPEVLDWWDASWRDRLRNPVIGYPIPVPTAVYALLRSFGESAYPTLVHGASLFFHLANLLLVGLLIRKWYGEFVAAIAATLWTLHPVVVESIAWATNLKTVMAYFFVLATMLLWERSLERESLLARDVAGSLLLFVLALGCRPDAAILPALLLWQHVRHGGDWRAPLERKSMYAAGLTLGLASALLGDAFHGDTLARETFLAFGDPLRQLSVIGYAAEVNLRNILIPLDIQPAYYLHRDLSFSDGLPGLALIVAGAAGLVLLLRRNRYDLAFPPGLAALLYVPFANLILVPRFAANTYLYLVSMAAMLAVVYPVITSLRDRSRGVRLGVAGIGLVVLVAFALGTRAQVNRWESPLSLWQPVLAAEPHVAKPYDIIAHSLWAAGDRENARKWIDRGLPVFTEAKQIPWWIPEAIAATGDPRLASRVALNALLHNKTLHDEHHRQYLEVLAKHRVPPPPMYGENLAATRKAIDVYLSHEEWLEANNAALALAAYFAAAKHPDLAKPFLREAFEQDEPDCAAWRVVAQIEAQNGSVDAPPRPERCSNR